MSLFVKNGLYDTLESIFYEKSDIVRSKKIVSLL